MRSFSVVHFGIPTITVSGHLPQNGRISHTKKYIDQAISTTPYKSTCLYLQTMCVSSNYIFHLCRMTPHRTQPAEDSSCCRPRLFDAINGCQPLEAIHGSLNQPNLACGFPPGAGNKTFSLKVIKKWQNMVASLACSRIRIHLW